ncbi:MAG: VTC domain-containing protein, partial [Lachnospiraceae bacterium]|nr:VTC domain-containing protein [Lachnospiraceae bacterium]
MKYMLDNEKKAAFIEALGDSLIPDDYPESDIMNIYYDTQDYHLVRKSLERPIYKEKLRLRTYGVPGNETP